MLSVSVGCFFLSIFCPLSLSLSHPRVCLAGVTYTTCLPAVGVRNVTVCFCGDGTCNKGPPPPSFPPCTPPIVYRDTLDQDTWTRVAYVDSEIVAFTFLCAASDEVPLIFKSCRLNLFSSANTHHTAINFSGKIGSVFCFFSYLFR